MNIMIITIIILDELFEGKALEALQQRLEG